MLFEEAHSLCSIKQKTIVSQENGRKHIAHNDHSCDVFQYRIDGDIIPPSTGEARCDYIVEIDKSTKSQTKRSAYLIELKGTDLNHAIDQIEATLKMFSNKLREYDVFLRIVYRSNTHAVNSPKVMKFKKKYGKRQRIGTNVMEESI